MRTLVILVVTLVVVTIIGCVRYEPYPNGGNKNSNGMDKSKVIIHHINNGKQ